MSYDTKLADRVRALLVNQDQVEERIMFGGLCFMVNGKMTICTRDNYIMCRLDPETYAPLLETPGVRQMTHGARVMKGFVYVEADALKTTRALQDWVDLTLRYNQKAKGSTTPRKAYK